MESWFLPSRRKKEKKEREKLRHERGWGDGAVGKGLAVQTGEPEIRPSVLMYEISVMMHVSAMV